MLRPDVSSHSEMKVGAFESPPCLHVASVSMFSFLSWYLTKFLGFIGFPQNLLTMHDPASAGFISVLSCAGVKMEIIQLFPFQFEGLFFPTPLQLGLVKIEFILKN